MLGWAVAGKLPAVRPPQERHHLCSSLARQQRLRGQLQPHLLSRRPLQPQRKSHAAPHRPRQRHNHWRPAHVNTRTRFNARSPIVSALLRAR
jgi:hypothetical protein